MAHKDDEPSKIRPQVAPRKRVLPPLHRLEINRIRSVQVDISKNKEDVHRDHDRPIRQVKVQTFMSLTILTFILRRDAAAHQRSGMKQILATNAGILAPSATLSATKAAAVLKTDLRIPHGTDPKMKIGIDKGANNFFLSSKITCISF